MCKYTENQLYIDFLNAFFINNYSLILFGEDSILDISKLSLSPLYTN
jgi:hypothetical protein